MALTSTQPSLRGMACQSPKERPMKLLQHSLEDVLSKIDVFQEKYDQSILANLRDKGGRVSIRHKQRTSFVKLDELVRKRSPARLLQRRVEEVLGQIDFTPALSAKTDLIVEAGGRACDQKPGTSDKTDVVEVIDDDRDWESLLEICNDTGRYDVAEQKISDNSDPDTCNKQGTLDNDDQAYWDSIECRQPSLFAQLRELVAKLSLEESEWMIGHLHPAMNAREREALEHVVRTRQSPVVPPPLKISKSLTSNVKGERKGTGKAEKRAKSEKGVDALGRYGHCRQLCTLPPPPRMEDAAARKPLDTTLASFELTAGEMELRESQLAIARAEQALIDSRLATQLASSTTTVESRRSRREVAPLLSLAARRLQNRDGSSSSGEGSIAHSPSLREGLQKLKSATAALREYTDVTPREIVVSTTEVADVRPREEVKRRAGKSLPSLAEAPLLRSSSEQSSWTIVQTQLCEQQPTGPECSRALSKANGHPPKRTFHEPPPVPPPATRLASKSGVPTSQSCPTIAHPDTRLYTPSEIAPLLTRRPIPPRSKFRGPPPIPPAGADLQSQPATDTHESPPLSPSGVNPQPQQKPDTNFPRAGGSKTYLWPEGFFTTPRPAPAPPQARRASQPALPLLPPICEVSRPENVEAGVKRKGSVASAKAGIASRLRREEMDIVRKNMPATRSRLSGLWGLPGRV